MQLMPISPHLSHAKLLINDTQRTHTEHRYRFACIYSKCENLAKTTALFISIIQNTISAFYINIKEL